MNAEERLGLRILISEARKIQVRQELERAGFHFCSGCGCGVDDRTVGCKRCKERHFKRRNRANKTDRRRDAPEYLIH